MSYQKCLHTQASCRDRNPEQVKTFADVAIERNECKGISSYRQKTSSRWKKMGHSDAVVTYSPSTTEMED